MDSANMMHGYDWAGEDLAGWYLSEKFDGCRAYWDGADLWTRGGHRVTRLPEHWQLPAGLPLDCELYDGIGGRIRCATALRHGKFASSMRLMVFDAPTMPGDWLQRIDHASELIADFGEHLHCAVGRVVSGTREARATVHVIQQRGGEGAMLRQPGQPYRPGRVGSLLKLKD